MNLYQHAVIFAGGKSSRMGQDKALLPFGGYNSLAQYQYEKLNQIFESVHISAKNNKFDFPCQVITDLYTDTSPLVGLISIFETLKAEAIFVLSVDTPFVDKEIIETLIKHDNKAIDILIAKSPNGIQPLCAIYKKSILPTLKEQYKANDHKLQNLFKKTDIKVVLFKENKAFMNLNYKEDYERALGINK